MTVSVLVSARTMVALMDIFFNSRTRSVMRVSSTVINVRVIPTAWTASMGNLEMATTVLLIVQMGSGRRPTLALASHARALVSPAKAQQQNA